MVRAVVALRLAPVVPEHGMTPLCGPSCRWLHKTTGAEVLQFGKLAANTYSLDFGFPITPMQAFGLLLCAFGWVGPTQGQES